MSSYGSRNERDGITSRFRLRGFDYALPGYYFVTICIGDRMHRLGTVRDGWFIPSAAGDMVLQIWEEQAERFPAIDLDECCVMPNHFHALIGIGLRGDIGNASTSLSTILQRFKAATSVAYGRGVRMQGWQPYDGRLWQKGYHDHIVRNDRDLERIRTYIQNNPANWPQDSFFTES